MANVPSSISLKFDQVFSGILEIFPGALGADFQTAVRVRCPAIMTLVEKVVWIRIEGLLGSIVACSVEPSFTLEALGITARQTFVCVHMPNHVRWDKYLTKVKRSVGIYRSRGSVEET